jgi:hypothetical protein
MTSASELFASVQEDLLTLTANLKDLVGARHPILYAAAEHLFEGKGKSLRPAIVLLVSRATMSDHDITPRHRRLAEITEMIEMHHRIRSCASSASRLVELFRRADIADFSLGMFPMGHSRKLIAGLKSAFPNRGFHWRLVQLGSRWLLQHPLNPLPMFRR